MWISVAAACLALLAGAPSARAQIVKPNILIIFDTSGSMLSSGNDGSPLCGGAGTTSRIYALKKALRDTLVHVGTDEANFGLQRFAQLEDPTQAPGCSYGHYYQNSSTIVGGDLGCKISAHTTETTYGPWFDTDYRQVILVDVTKKPSPGPVAASTDFDPADGNLPAVYRWIDLEEDSDTIAPISDPELRTDNNWYTPLGRSLFYARMYFDNYVKPTDPRAGCRENVVILVTDGSETCDSTTGTVNADCSGGTNEFMPRRAACRLYVGSGIKVHVLTDTSTGSANDSIAAAGGTGAAIRVDLTDSSAAQAALLGVIADAVPPGESCNCLDDNCNALVDEPWASVKGTPCSVGIGECLRSGVLGCDGTGGGVVCISASAPSMCGQTPLSPGPTATEVCNGKDDDCNGIIDDGVPGGCTCVMSTEVCNGKDDNCNGMTDEPPVAGEGSPCGSSKGICTPGSYTCSGGKLTCTGGTGPGTEVCNGLDDNCNGATDETDPEAGKKCYPAATKGCDLAADTCQGLCRFGAKLCEGGTMVCKFSQGPVAEKCNGLDDDCDGTVDNGFDVGTACDNGKMGACKRIGMKVCSATGGTTCTAPGASGSAEVCNGMDDDCDGMTDEGSPLPGEGLPCGVGIGECMSGTTKCEGGMIVCKGGKGPGVEVCDGKDNNCNGLIDEGVPGEGDDCLCPGLDMSKVGVGKCKGGKTVCKGTMGLGCEGCVFPEMEICNGEDDDCDGSVDTTAPCPGGFACRNGECAPQCKAGEFPCPAGQKCDKGYCVPEPCAGKDCGGRVCKDGKCVDPCAEMTCTGPGQSCVDGACHDCYTDGCPNPGDHCEIGMCKPDPCDGVVCRVSEFCSGGLCVRACDTVTCPPGQRCAAGKCAPDVCAGVACTDYEYCDSGTGECKFNPCKTTMCMFGSRCVPRSGMCLPDPCESVFCNRDCLRCELTPDGVADCVGPPSCKAGKLGPPLASSGGGGCTTCAVGAGDAGAAGGGGGARGALAGLILLSVVTARRRRGPRQA